MSEAKVFTDGIAPAGQSSSDEKVAGIDYIQEDHTGSYAPSRDDPNDLELKLMRAREEAYLKQRKALSP